MDNSPGCFSNPDLIRKILIIQVSRIGDTLLSTPTIQAISNYFSNAKITVLGHPNRADVFCNIPFIHAVGEIEKKTALWRGWCIPKSFDLAFVFGHDEPLVNYALRVAHRVIAMEQKSISLNRKLFYAAPVPMAMSRHAVRMQYSLIENLKIPLVHEKLTYVVDRSESEWANFFLRSKNLFLDFPLIGLQIASFPTKGYRDWPVGHFLELTNRIISRYPKAHFLIFGGKLERERTLYLAEELGAKATHLAGELTLRQTAACMNCLDYYIGVDTGPTHIMGALHKPMMAFYHPSSPSKFLKPLQHPALTAVDHPLAGQVGPEASMAGLTVDSVWAQLEPALATLKAP